LRIPTCSQAPLRNGAEILSDDKASLLAVGRIYRRKNFEQFKRIASASGLRSHLKGDHYPLSEAQYLCILDRFPIYLCTSFQEGGPLPVMDAMRRGAVVISTRVGQIPEIIEHGVTGFICESDSEFLKTITELSNDPKLLHSLRLASLRHIQEVRNEADIGRKALQALETILESSPS